MRPVGAYCDLGEHEKCPRASSCSCDSHRGSGSMVAVRIACGVGDCSFTTTTGAAVASHRRNAHGSNVAPTLTTTGGGIPPAPPGPRVTSPAAAIAQALDRPVASLNGDGLVWEEPPKAGAHRGSIVSRAHDAVQTLRTRPGQWARIATYTKSSTGNSTLKRLRAAYTDCEFRAAAFGEHGSAVWARCKVDAGE